MKKNILLFFLTCTVWLTAAPKIAFIEVVPNKTRLTPGESIVFKATAYDNDAEPMDFELEWEATGGVIEESGKYTAGSKKGVYMVMAKDVATGAQGTAYIHIARPVADRETRLDIEPEEVTLKPGQSIQFKISYYEDDVRQSRVPPLSLSVVGGKIDSKAYFTAGKVPGKYTFQAKTSSGVIGFANIIVLGEVKKAAPKVEKKEEKKEEVKPIRRVGPRISIGRGPKIQISMNRSGVPIRIKLEPSKAFLEPGEKVKFKVIALDKNGKKVPLKYTSWSVEGGAIEADGTFTAGEYPGEFKVTVKGSGELKATAKVTISE